MREMTSEPRVQRVEAEARLVAARGEGNTYAEVSALADLVEITHETGDVFGLVTYAEQAWETAERYSYWSHLARLAAVFGDFAYHVQEYQRAFDHYANSLAFASTASHDDFMASIARVDSVLAELMTSARGAVAASFAEMLVAYEAAGGLNRPDSAFSAHYQNVRRLAEELAREDLSSRGIWLN